MLKYIQTKCSSLQEGFSNPKATIIYHYQDHNWVQVSSVFPMEIFHILHMRSSLIWTYLEHRLNGKLLSAYILCAIHMSNDHLIGIQDQDFWMTLQMSNCYHLVRIRIIRNPMSASIYLHPHWKTNVLWSLDQNQDRESRIRISLLLDSTSYYHLIGTRIRNPGSKSPLTGHILPSPAQQGSGYENLDQDQGVPQICFISLDLVYSLPPQLRN